MYCEMAEMMKSPSAGTLRDCTSGFDLVEQFRICGADFLPQRLEAKPAREV